jgi:fused signal recognition particle receptor
MKNIFAKLTQGLSNTSAKLNLNLKKAFSLNKPKEELLEEIEESLIESDLGVHFSMEITETLRRTNFSQEISKEIVADCLREKLTDIFQNIHRDLVIPDTNTVYTIMFSGINGSGKTTTIGKIAAQLTQQGKKVLIAAGDTFRASAVEQLTTWATRAKADIFVANPNSDPASVAYQALKKAQTENFDVLLIDTAGRVPNNSQLMDELKKINNVIKKLDTDAPQLNLLVIDATIGQTALKQVEIFHKDAAVNGIIITKLDGTARAGAIVPITEKFKLPIYFIGLGEAIADLQKFSAEEFIDAILREDS